MNAIETHSLTKYYGSTRGIEDLTLSVEEGDFFGFIGPNGAGKSTTIRALLGLIRPTSGNALVLGMDAQANRSELLRQVGYLSSEASFYRGMRVEELLRFSAGLRGLDCSAEAARLAARLELDTRRRVDQLSLGNRKKVGIVCALQHKPRLLILDEPTSGLDPLIQREFFDLLGERQREGATVFLSSHILSEIGRYCKRAAVIRDGRLLASDLVERLGDANVKQITLKGVTEIPVIEGARRITREGDRLCFSYNGDPKALLASLSALSFSDITITDPAPEDILLHYYEQEGD